MRHLTCKYACYYVYGAHVGVHQAEPPKVMTKFGQVETGLMTLVATALHLGLAKQVCQRQVST